MRREGDDVLWDVFHQEMFDAETQVLKWYVIIKKNHVYKEGLEAWFGC